MFVAPSKLQLDVFDRLLGSPGNAAALVRGMSSVQSLATSKLLPLKDIDDSVDLLRKVANSPTVSARTFRMLTPLASPKEGGRQLRRGGRPRLSAICSFCYPITDENGRRHYQR